MIKLPAFTSLHDAATFYSDLGWCVLPIRKENKFPSVKWKQYQTKHPSPEELEKWFKKDGVRIGLLTGEASGVVVVDADSLEAVAELQRRGCWSETRVRTARGLQLYFRRGEEAVKTTQGIIPKVDIRADRGIAVLPPSLHATGVTYTWESFNIENLPVYNPKWFPEKSPENFNTHGWVSECLLNLAELPRRPTLIKIAGRLLYNGWSLEDACTVLHPHAEAAGLSDEEFFNCMESIRGYEIKNDMASVSVSDLLNNTREVDFVVQNAIPRESVTIVGGVPKMGKSWLLLDLALELSRGGKWMGLLPCAPCKVLYFDEENASTLLSVRLRKLLKVKQFTPSYNVQFVIGQGINFSDPNSVMKIKDKLNAFHPDVVMVDSLIRVHREDENSSTELAGVFSTIHKLTTEYKCAFIFADHEGKSAYAQRGQEDVIKEPSPGDLRGSSEKSAFADVVFSFRKQAGIRMLYQTQARWAEPLPPTAVAIDNLGPGEVVVRGEHVCSQD